MKSIWEIPYIVVDVETTGSKAELNRITEVAGVKVIGGEISDTFNSLVNPHQFIPEFIQRMTGITNEMAAAAPEGSEVFPEFRKFLSVPEAVFVAHNVNFDWGFVSASFQREGINIPDLPRLCSLKLARRVLATSIKKGVGNLAKFFAVKVNGRHRALGDAAATAEILLELLEMAEQEHGVKTIDELLKFQHKSVKRYKQSAKIYNRVSPFLDKLPAEPGVYYFKNKNDDILYIGKAKSLNNRVKSYFSSGAISSKKIKDLTGRIHTIDWECTGTELAALLMESREIKRYQPPFNTVEKRYRKLPFIKLNIDDEYPTAELSFNINNDGAEYYGPFRSSFLVQDILKIIERQFKLRKCTDPIHPDPESRTCFYYQIHRCDAPCASEITHEEYSREVERVRKFLSGCETGIIDQLEKQMYDFADKLEFERAEFLKRNIYELKKILERDSNVPTSINDNNVILILPANEREKTVELFFIKGGRLMHQELIGRKASLRAARKMLHTTYFNGVTSPLFFTLDDMDELRILSGWLYRQKDSGKFLYINGKKEDDLADELETAIRNISY